MFMTLCTAFKLGSFFNYMKNLPQVRYHESGSLLPAIAPQLLSDYNSQSSFLESIETQDRIYSFYQTSHDVEH